MFPFNCILAKRFHRFDHPAMSVAFESVAFINRRSVRLLHATLLTFGFLERGEKGVARRWESGKLAEVASFPRGGGSGGKPGFGFPRLPRHRLFHGLWVVPAGGRTPHSVPPHGDRSESIPCRSGAGEWLRSDPPGCSASGISRSASGNP